MKWYILVVFFVTGLSIAGLLIVSFNIDPYKSDIQVKYLFFASLFVVLWGFSALALNRFHLKTDWPDFYKSFKIGFLISVLFSLGLFFVRLFK